MKEKVKIVFVYQVPSFWTSWECLYEKLVEDERFDVRIFWISDYAGDKAQMEGADKFLRDKGISFENFTFEKITDFKPDYMVYQTPYDIAHRPDYYNSIRYKRMGIKIVYFPYGIEISDTFESRYKHFSLPLILNADIIYTMSDVMKAEYEKWCINSGAVRALGVPRIDALKRVYDEVPEVAVRRNGRKVILWKVHFPKQFIIDGKARTATPSLDEYYKFTEYIADNKDLFFIFMPHPKFVDETIDPELRKKALKLLERLEKLSNVYIDNNPDYRNSLTNADAIMVDRSAVMVEAGVTGVPVMYLYNGDYKEPMTAPIENMISSYYQGSSAEDMIAFCEMQKRDQDPRKEEREKALVENIQYLDGQCCERIADSFIEMADRPVNRKKKDVRPGSRFLLWGAGLMGEECFIRMNKTNKIGAVIVGIVDSSKASQGKEINGVKVISPNQISEIDFDYIVVATEKYYREVYLRITEELEIDKDKVMNYDELFNLMAIGS